MNMDSEQAGTAFRERLRELRDARGHDTDYAFALELGVNPSTMSTWMRSALPRLDALVGIATSCDISLDWLSGLSEAGGPIYAVEVKTPPAGANDQGARARKRRLQQAGADGVGQAARPPRGRRAAGQ